MLRAVNLHFPHVTRPTPLQRKVLFLILAIVVLPMLAAAGVASAWVSSGFESRLERWIVDAAHIGQTWLQANQNDALLLGAALVDDPGFVASLDQGGPVAMPAPIDRIARDLGISFMQVYTPDQRLVYSTTALPIQANWEPGQTESVLRVGGDAQRMLAAIGIIPVPRTGTARHYLVLGTLLDQTFIGELSQLSGLRTRLYYREGERYIDVLSAAGRPRTLRGLPAAALRRLTVEKKPYYSIDAEAGLFRGQYTPVTDPSGRVEAIVFSGLERRGFEDLLGNRIALFIVISLLGVVVAVAVGLLLSRLVLRPIEQLRNGVLQLAAQDFQASVPIRSSDELGDLAKAFNAMAVSLRQARDRQQQAFQRDKLAALGELSASLAHEIRNPIGVINTSAALMDKPGQDDARRAELLRMIREESARVNSLVQDFLQLSRYRQPQLTVIDPVLALERALATALAGIDRVQIRRRLEHGGGRVLADAGLLQQAWGNVLTNALQAMGSSGGKLWVTTSRDGDRLLLSVEDSGPGVPPDVAPRLFEPFYTTKEQGTGLGLSIAHTLVEASGGALTLLPPEHGGARFGMRFPVYKGDQT